MHKWLKAAVFAYESRFSVRFLTTLGVVEVRCEKHQSFLNFSYVCPEPVLVK